MSFRLAGRKRTRRQAGLGVARRPAKRITVVRAVAVPRMPVAVTERKYFDEERAATAIVAVSTDFASAEADPGTVNTLFAPTTGNDFNNRIGRKVDVLGIKIRGDISIAAQTNQSAADGPTMIRMMLVQDKQTNAAQLNSEDVLTSGDATQGINMFRNPAFFSRFQIWKDKTIVMQSPSMTFDGTNVEQSGLIRPVKMNMKFRKPIRVTFNATNGGTVADIIDNSFHVLCACSSNALAPQLEYKCRTTFVDP